MNEEKRREQRGERRETRDVRVRVGEERGKYIVGPWSDRVILESNPIDPPSPSPRSICLGSGTKVGSMIAKTEEVCALLLLGLPRGLRVGADGTNHRYEEGDHVPLYANKELFQMFGLPYIIAPTEQKLSVLI
uniref:Uncharacterized protein n=1 Tax=Musa acuminata subsp. malaccensis TaxID=214687 RepID=A0A804HXU8_MUSAM